MLTLGVAVVGYLLNAFGARVIEDGDALFTAYCCEMLLSVFCFGFFLILRGKISND